MVKGYWGNMKINGWEKLEKLPEEKVGNVTFKMVLAKQMESKKYQCHIDVTGTNTFIQVTMEVNETNFSVKIEEVNPFIPNTILYQDWWKHNTMYLRNPKVFFKKIIEEADKQHRYSQMSVFNPITGSNSITGSINLWNLNNF